MNRSLSQFIYLLLALLAMLLLTAPLPLPETPQQQRVARLAALPTARMLLASPTPAPLIASPSPVPSSPVPEPSATAVAASPTAAVPTPSLWPSPEPWPTAELAMPVGAVPTLMPIVVPAPAAPAEPELLPPGTAVYVPTLMYHYIREVDQLSDPLGYNLSVTPSNLEAQLDLLVERGYTTLRMDALARCISAQQPCPAHAVALTFDDGYDDAFTTALPALLRRGMVATFYIVSGFVGQPGYMSWQQVQALRDAGMEVGAHTVNHPDLTTLGLDQARYEIADSRAQIEAAIGGTVVSFCYPVGRFNDTIAALVRDAGYTNATTTLPDLGQHDLMLLPRLRVDGSYGAAEIGWMLQETP